MQTDLKLFKLFNGPLYLYRAAVRSIYPHYEEWAGGGGAGAGGLSSFRSLNYTNGAPVDLNIVNF